jgi:predicted transcriptional regulator
MNKCIILSVKPQWLHKILTGQKTIEIRKSMPKCDYPIDVYLYCTKGDINLYKVFKEVYMYFDMGVAASFADFKYYELSGYDYSNKGKARFYTENGFYDEIYRKLNGKIVAKFMLNKVDKINNCGSCFEIANESYAYTNAIGNRSCLEFNDMKKYLNNRNGYAWHIDNLEFFNEPMKLREFKYECLKGEKNRCDGCDFYYFNQNESVGTEEECLCDCMPRLTRPFPSWGYAYKEE